MIRLEAQHISKSFGGVKAVQDFSFQLNQHEIVSIIGPNGAGKTTAFNLLTGVYEIDSGKILLDGQDITGLQQHQIAKSGIARTFQNIRLFKGLNVIENVMTAADPLSSYNLFDAIISSRRKQSREAEVRELSRSYLKTVGLTGYENEKPENLSYGLQRKLEIARALATQPKVLLLDEPAAGLNPSEVRDFISLVRELRDEFQFSIVIIEHRMEVIMELSKRIYVLNFGKLLASGTPDEIRNNKEVLEAYIGEEDPACLL
jgi:branched-chain amino acid transport system ATP-binding protein